MRIAVGQLWQETNTLNPLATTWADFEPMGVYYGAELIDKLATVNEVGGFMQAARQWPDPPELVGLARFAAWPSGPATRDTLARIFAEFLLAFQAAGPVDAVYLALHGAMVADGTPDVEGALLTQVRGVVGAGTPIVASLDLHTNITRQMVEQADALVLYHTAPHIDVYETGQRAAKVLRRLLVEQVQPVTAFQKLPMVVPAERANTQDPDSVSSGFRALLERYEADPDVLCAGLAPVQPWLDIPEMGTSVVVVTAGDVAKAERYCRELSDEVWRHRQDYLPELFDIGEAIWTARRHTAGPVVLGDAADATNSGSTGEGTAILTELIQHEWPRLALTTMVAPYAVQEAQRRGLGARYFEKLGGVRDTRFSKSIILEVEVVNLFEAKFILTGHIGKNMPIDMGPSAVLAHGDVRILVSSRSGPQFAPDFFRVAGFEPFDASLVVAKSPCGFRAAYQDRAVEIIMLRSPGCAPSDFWNYEYKNIPRPLWPWDEIDDWKPAPTIMFPRPV